MARTELIITANEAGQRLDRFMRKLLPMATNGEIFKLIRTKRVSVNERKVKPDTRLAVGDLVLVHGVKVPEASVPVASEVPKSDVPIVHQDDNVLVVDKPAGMLVHVGDKGEEGGTLAAWALSYLYLHGLVPSPTFRPAPAHRLDAHSSGLIVITKTAPAARAWSEAFRERALTKLYTALVFGPLADVGRIDAPIHRRLDGGVAVGEGDEAITEYRVTQRGGEWSLVELHLVTGRKHQLRAHLANAGAPIAGDPRYAGARINASAREELGLERMFLHAGTMSGKDPVTHQEFRWEAPLPPQLQAALRAAMRSDG